MKTYEEMARSALSHIESCQIEKRKRRKTAALIAIPVMCVCLAAVLGLFAWQSGITEAPTTDGGMVALSEGPKDIPELPVEASEPETPKAPPAKPADPAPEEPGRTPAKINNAAPAKPEYSAPVKPVEIPAEPEGETPAAPEETPSEQPDEAVPEPTEEEPPVKPEEEPSAEPSSGNIEEQPEEPEPQQDPTPQGRPDIRASYRMEEGREYVTLTLMSTGEVEEFDVTGWRDQSYARPSGEQPGQVEAQSSSMYARQCSAFGVIVMCFLSVDENNEVHVNTVTITLQQNEPLTPEESDQARAAKEAAEAAEAAAREALAGSASN